MAQLEAENNEDPAFVDRVTDATNDLRATITPMVNVSGDCLATEWLNCRFRTPRVWLRTRVIRMQPADGAPPTTRCVSTYFRRVVYSGACAVVGRGERSSEGGHAWISTAADLR